MRPKKTSIFEAFPTQFSWDDIANLEEIGRGSFGCVFTAKQRNGEMVVVKKLLRQHERETRLFVKEARILNSLRHKNIVELKAVCEKPIAMMLEHVFFDFAPFKLEGRVNSLEGYLDFLSDNEDVVSSFACMHMKIAKDAACGLEYLHGKNIAHRDLKPGNVLISNQHYCHSSEEKILEAWAKEPVVCKLVDFGESRAELQQTATLCHTRTLNLDRGTIAYMAPELLAGSGLPMSLEELKACDVWALGMMIFLLLNPDLEFPYQYELDQVPQKTVDSLKCELASRFKKGMLPTWSTKYEKLQATAWWEMELPFKQCARFSPKDRPKCPEIVQSFRNSKHGASCRDIPLSVSQTTAVDRHDTLVAAGATPLNADVPNDATNSCSFLSVIITDLFVEEGTNVTSSFDTAKWDLLARRIDNIIITMPRQFNPLRSTGVMYDVSEAYAILRNADIVPTEYELREEIVTPHSVFSKTGREALLKAVHAISTDQGGTKIAIYSCGIYIFVVGCQSKQLFIVDTHPISEQLGGDGNGIVKVYTPQNADSPNQLCAWIWKRLEHSGVPDSSLQSFLIFEEQQR